ncbi:MAG: CDP-alcohol phosphatidyltransferase family protein [Nitrospirales bacterium]|nr:CDP-alcohol phosphatidyltransferase family protein [Nitrospira sp.]MDR4500150.1 CDP-alcohol phosphatidyltransferase family protein [Nitrospirales bacterium]
MDGTLNKPATSVIDTAILLTSSGVFNLGESPKVGDPSALTTVGGLTLFQRAILTLQRAGISQIWVLAGTEEKRLRAMIQEDGRIQAAIRWLPIREFPPTDPQTWEALAGEVKGSCLIIGCQTVFSTSLVQSLRMVGTDGRALLVVGRAKENQHTDNPGVVFQEEANPETLNTPVVFLDHPDEGVKKSTEFIRQTASFTAGDMVMLPSRLLGVSGVLHTRGCNPLRLALEQAAIEGIIQPVPTASSQFRDVRGPHGVQIAERSLYQSLQSLKGGMDGLVDRYVNRKFSGIFTRLFLKLGLTPNMITMVSMVLGLIAAGFFAVGSYQLGVIGALLFQLSVIIDCCDGEVARLTFSESRFGQELDIWADNVVHMAIFAGIASGAYLHGPWEGMSLPLWLGLCAVVANMVSLWLVNRARFLRSRPQELQRLDESTRSRIEFLLSNVTNRDFSVIILAFACFNILGWFLLIAAFGAWVFIAALGWVLRQSLLPRA